MERRRSQPVADGHDEGLPALGLFEGYAELALNLTVAQSAVELHLEEDQKVRGRENDIWLSVARRETPRGRIARPELERSFGESAFGVGSACAPVIACSEDRVQYLG